MGWGMLNLVQRNLQLRWINTAKTQKKGKRSEINGTQHTDQFCKKRRAFKFEKKKTRIFGAGIEKERQRERQTGKKKMLTGQEITRPNR